MAEVREPMMFDWDATCDRPLSVETVWTLMQAGCNANEIAAAGDISLATAIGLMNLAVPRGSRSGVLHRESA